MKRYKLKYKTKLTKDGLIGTKVLFFRTYLFAYHKFKQIISERDTICAFIDKFDRDTGEYNNPINNYKKYGQSYLKVR